MLRCSKTIVYSGLCINPWKMKVGIFQKGAKEEKRETEERKFGFVSGQSDGVTGE